VIERLETHHLEKPHRGAVQLRLAWARRAPDFGDQIAQLEVGEHALAVNTAHFFDFINVVEAPDTATIARVSVALAARGSTKVETLPALTIDELLAALS